MRDWSLGKSSLFAFPASFFDRCVKRVEGGGWMGWMGWNCGVEGKEGRLFIEIRYVCWISYGSGRRKYETFVASVFRTESKYENHDPDWHIKMYRAFSQQERAQEYSKAQCNNPSIYL